MPKRRMTAKRRAAIVKWQRAGAGARAKTARFKYTGKTMTLYHRTSPWAADRIKVRGREDLKSTGGFITGRGRGFQRYETKVFASNRRNGQAEGYGTAVVRIRVPRNKVSLDDQFPSGERHYSIDPKDIKSSAVKVMTGKRVR